jgi:stage V sporulation protein G
LNITEVRVKLMRNRSDRLRAFCSITIDDDFVVHDLRVIEGRKGFFVAMPSRKLADNCPRCGSKNELRSKFCSDCGARLEEGRQRAVKRDKVHVDVAHPINTACREMLQEMVLAAYQEEAAKGAEAADAGTEEEYYAETSYPEPEPELSEEYYEEEARAETVAAEEEEIEAEALEVVEVVEAALEEEQEVAFPLEAPHPDILEKEQDAGSELEDALAEEEPFIEELEEIEEVADFRPAAPRPPTPPGPGAPPPARPLRVETEGEEQEAETGRESSQGPVRRRTRRPEGGGFGEGIL